ncbi:MAG: hypothetical protein V4864_08215 [Pseudomonadota bacterium]
MAGYLPFFSVAVAHGFHGGGPWPQLEWRPDAQTQRLLERSGCMAGPSRDGLAVFFDSDRRKLLASCLADAREPMVLRWQLHAPGLPLETVTEGAPTHYGPVLFLSNAAAVHEAETGMWRLHAGETVGAGDWLPPGVPALAGPFDTGRRGPRVPTVQLGFGPDDLPSTAAGDAGKRFRIRFAARATVWKYFFVGDFPADGLEVVDLEHIARFEPPKPEQLSDGRAALTVRSADPIVLQRQPTQRFQLLRREDGRESVVIARLPAAAAGSLMRDATEGTPAMVSEIYV